MWTGGNQIHNLRICWYFLIWFLHWEGTKDTTGAINFNYSVYGTIATWFMSLISSRFCIFRMQLWSKKKIEDDKEIETVPSPDLLSLPSSWFGSVDMFGFSTKFQQVSFLPVKLPVSSFSYNHPHIVSFQNHLLVISSNVSFLSVKWLCFLLLKSLLSQIPASLFYSKTLDYLFIYFLFHSFLLFQPYLILSSPKHLCH